MLKSHERFYTEDGRRLILIVDDEPVNREMLGMILGDEYEILQAGDGEEGLRIIRENSTLLSLVILDLMMPNMSGQELLGIIKKEEQLQRIPVIVLTSDKSAEVAMLQLGASDFIMKPYDMPEVVRARVRRTIELGEDTYIIQNTERDELTGLLNKEFFYRYSELFKLHHPSVQMDALILDVNNFHLINEIQGRAFGDEVLSKIGSRIMAHVAKTGGVAGRGYADMFMLYLPSGTDYEELHQSVESDLTSGLIGPQVHLRFGVYEGADKTLPMERCFDRAKMAADLIRDNYNQGISLYDDDLHARDLQNQRLIDDIQKAIDERQFLVYYQPKYEITGEEPVLKSAEALIRWKHPELGMISPGVFIPLLEGNGLIRELDHYVWREAAGQIRRWKDTPGRFVPVSVNVSRIDMLDPELTETILGLAEMNRLACSDLHLEITESAYTQDAQRIVGVVSGLRRAGFVIEMDDFGSGYSSLNMISTLPIDALKLDMMFIRTAFSGNGDTRMIGITLDISRALSVPLIAEGVETEEQMLTLKEMGCDIVQGYYFAKPMPPEEFESFLK